MADLIQTLAGPLTVRRATPADVDAVLAVVRAAAAWVATRGSDQWAYYLTAGAADLVAGRIARHEVYLAHDGNGRAVGTFCLQWADTAYWPNDGDDGSAGYVHQLATDAWARGRGVGAALIAWAADRMRSTGRTRFRLDCLAANADLCAYYERLGFGRAGTIAPYGVVAQRFERAV